MSSCPFPEYRSDVRVFKYKDGFISYDCVVIWTEYLMNSKLERIWKNGLDKFKLLSRNLNGQACKVTKTINHYTQSSSRDSNKSTNQTHQSLRFIARRSNTAQHVSGVLVGPTTTNDTATTTFQR
jgi:hypothetical protein